MNLVVDENGEGIVVAQGCGGSEEDDARMRLITAAPDMARVLLAIEEKRKDSLSDLGDALGHEIREMLDAALRKAGVR